MNYKMIIQYDGTRYNGWQRQSTTENTIQGKLEAILTKMTGTPVEIQGAGRTDAGVHAKGQVAHFQIDTDKTPEEIKNYINTYLPDDIGVLTLTQASPRFHSRLNAIGKIYCYHIAKDRAHNIFNRKYVYVHPEPLDVEAMKMATIYLHGQHDFKSFCGNGHIKKSTVRAIHNIQIEEDENEIRMTFHGNGFLQYMVRILAGTLIEVGEGKRDPHTMIELLETKDRKQAGATAPACGLTLVQVLYD
ncbi:MAG: tRNA pseudouridine(38-40) synthase TruA [Lachnospiraceae bacterium]|nr:tRNA pseudouridine(38-40) synthase TruA [Lachnospiraceae bacterium]